MTDEDHVIVTRKILVSKEDMEALNKLQERKREEGLPEWRVRDVFIHYAEQWGSEVEDEECGDGAIITRKFRVSNEDMAYGMGILDKIRAKGVPEDRIKWYFSGFVDTYGKEVLSD